MKFVHFLYHRNTQFSYIDNLGYISIINTEMVAPRIRSYEELLRYTTDYYYLLILSLYYYYLSHYVLLKYVYNDSLSTSQSSL